MLERASLLLALITLIVGGIVGYGLGRSDAPVPPPETGHEELRRVVEKLVETPPPSPEIVPMPTPEAASRLAQAIALLPRPEASTGTGSITGRVWTQEGEPVAGVVIRATLIPIGPRPDPETATLEEVVRSVVHHHRRDRLTRVEATTGVDGRYTLSGLLDADYRLSATRDGYQVFLLPGARHHRVRPGAEVDFQARAQIEVPVRVLDPDGREPDSIFVSIGRKGVSGYGMTWSPKNRVLRLTPGRRSLQARTADGTLVSNTVVLDLAVGETQPEVVLTLVGKPGLRGRVTFADEIERDQLTVALRRIVRESDADPSTLDRARKRTTLWRHDEMKYVFPDLTPGTYLLGAYDDEALLHSIRVTMGDAPVEQDLVVPAPDPGEYVVVRVLGPDGKPAKSVSFSSGYRTKTGRGSGGGTTQRLPDGSWRVFFRREHLAEKDARHYIVARSEDLGAKEVEVVPGRDRELTVEFGAPAKLTLTLARLSESGYEDVATVSLDPVARSVSSWSFHHRREQRQPGDPFVFEGLVPGDYEVRVRIEVARHETMEVLSEPVNLAAGDNAHTIAFPVLHELVVIAEGESRLSLSMQGGRRAGVDLKVPKGGRATFRGLPAGTYDIRGRSRQGGGMTVKVPSPGPVRFEPKPISALAVTITDTNGTLYQAGFRNGDVIIGADGKEFESMRDMQSAFVPRKEETPPRFLIQRGGTRVEIAVDLTELMQQEGEHGGRIEPTHR